MGAIAGTRRALLANDFSPFDLKPRLYLDAIREAARRGIVAPVLSSGAVGLVDGFNRADGVVGSAPTGQAYTVVSGTWSIASGTMRTALTDSTTVLLLGVTAANPRFSYRTRTTNTASVSQMMVRYIDANNYIGCYHLPSVGLRIFKFDGGVSTTLATAGAGKAANTWNTVELRATGNQIDAYLDGVLTTQYTLSGADATKFGATTGVAFGRNGATSATVEYDDVTLSTGASALLLDKWSDDSGNGFDFTQATAAKQPLLTWTVSASGSILVPVVRFDGVDDLLVRSAIDISSALQGHVHIALARTTAIAGYYLTSNVAGTTARYMIVQQNSTKMRVTQRNNDTADAMDGNTIMAANTPYLIDAESDGSTYSAAVNGAAQTLTATVGANTGDWYGDVTGATNFAIAAAVNTGETGFLAFDAHSIVLTDAVLGGNLLSLQRYNNRRYGMNISL